MYQKLIPCLHFPTTLIFVDDEPTFSQSVCFKLGDRILSRTFASAQAAQQFLSNHQPIVNTKDWRIDQASDEVRPFDIAVSKIRQVMYVPHRFEEIAVVVADYAMPDGNGLDLFKTLLDLPFKRILLTGEADEKIAVQAFNAGLIHRYIRKDSADYLTQLQAAVQAMEAQYFVDLSETVFARLTNNGNYVRYCLDDPRFIAFFNQFLTEQAITEFYLVSSTGSFLLLDAQGKSSGLVVKDEEEMQFYTEMAEEDSSAAVQNALAERRCVPLFLDGAEELPEGWDDSLHPAQRIEGTHTSYYIAHVNQPILDVMEKKQTILPYQVFLDNSV